MAIHCPACARKIDLKGAHTGRFTPACPFCRQRFVLQVPADGSAPRVERLAASAPLSHETTPRGAVETMAPPVSAGLGVAVPTDAPPPPHRVQAPPRPSQTPKGEPRTIPRPGAAAPPTSEDDVTGTLGGYRIVHKLGQGGMGAVYRARQLSLDRDVALKVLLDRLAADPTFVARFTREAYAAAQISHHHMVQIHDIGAQQRKHFFSMEFVNGKTLAELLEEQGRLEPEQAANYVLQAARGLKFAHDHGMIHRDVKPENLLLSDIGMVKVADLGLVKTLEPEKLSAAAAAKIAAQTGSWYENQTQLNISMGTPSYMPPEQALDAASVDARADIYALGCTLYTLLVGRPPFEGRDAEEVINRHINEEPTAPDDLIEDLPPSLVQIVLTMIAKRPEDRYQDMGEVAGALEGFLGMPSHEPFAAKAEQIKTLENCAAWFNGASWASARNKAMVGFFGLCALLAGAALLAPFAVQTRFMLTGAVIGLAVLTPLMYILLTGVTQKTYLFMKVRELIWTGGVMEWLTILSAAALGVAVLVVLGWHWAWLIAAAAALGAAMALHYGMDGKVAEQRRAALGHVGALLKTLRGQGVAEPVLRQLVCRHSGEHWEEFFESLFGYEAKVQARQRWGKAGDSAAPANGDPGRPRPRWAAWRDPVIQWIDQRIRLRRAARERRLIQAIEEQSLRKQGILESMARRQAQRLAEQMVAQAMQLREQTMQRAMEIPPPAQASPPAPAESSVESAAEPARPEEPAGQLSRPAGITARQLNYKDGLEGWEHHSYFQRRYGSIWNLVFGPPVRFIVGAALLLICMKWIQENELLNALLTGGLAHAQHAFWLPGLSDLMARPIEMINAAAAGMLLIVSSFFRRPTVGLWILISVVVVLLGGAVLPPIAGLSAELLALAAGGLVAMLGLVFTRSE